MKLPKIPVNNQIYSAPVGTSKLKWNGYAWDRVTTESTSADTTTIKSLTQTVKENPIGNTDGYNFIFTLETTPIYDTEMVFMNGQLQKRGEDYDYLMYDNAIYFIEPPYENSTVTCVYQIRSKAEIKNEKPVKIGTGKYALNNEISEGDELVFLNGLLLTEGSDYTVTSNIINFNIEIFNEDVISVHYFSKN